MVATSGAAPGLGTEVRVQAPGARVVSARSDRLVALGARHPVGRAVVNRLALAVPLVFVVSALTFVLVSLSPGNAATQILGENATPAEMSALRAALGLNLPVYEQYWRWLRQALTGNMGTSLITGEAVSQEIAQRLPVTLCLIFGGLLVSIVMGMGAGVFSAVRRGRLGRATDGLVLVGYSLPVYWVGPALTVLFAVKLHWLPATGYVGFAQSPLQWSRSLVLPVCTVSLYGVAVTAKQTREAMLDALAAEHVRMAWANGIAARSVILRHALKNASVRVVTVLGVVAVGLLGGTVFVEDVFGLPGLGSLVVNGALQGDIPVVQGVAVCFTVVVVVINLLIDLAYTWLNPRLRVI